MVAGALCRAVCEARQALSGLAHSPRCIRSLPAFSPFPPADGIPGASHGSGLPNVASERLC